MKSNSYWLTRIYFLRSLGFIYFISFLSLTLQFKPLLGEHGLLPAADYISKASTLFESKWWLWAEMPSLFFLDHNQNFMLAMGVLGIALSLFVMLGVTNALVQFVLFGLYTSFYHVGQIFYGYGWEMMLLETGFLSIFLCPVFSFTDSTPCNLPASSIVMFLIRWVAFRVMFGAGLIKLRGDLCWRDLTCLMYHFETQPIPNPVSWYLHQLPEWILRFGVIINHLVEVILPFFMLGPKRLRTIGGIGTILFQIMLIVSGNLSFLNYLTIVICLACFDDDFWTKWARLATIERVKELVGHRPAGWYRKICIALLLLMIWLSIDPVMNLLGPNQRMNFSYNSLNLGNTYGAFGHIGKERDEIVIQGSNDDPDTPEAKWSEYEFHCKPGDVSVHPCIVSPYHFRLDWQVWFAAMSELESEPWLIHLVWKLLQADPLILGAIKKNPFSVAPPKYIRIELYRYRFTTFEDKTGDWWKRRRIRAYMPPVSLDTSWLSTYVREKNWAVVPGG